MMGVILAVLFSGGKKWNQYFPNFQDFWNDHFQKYYFIEWVVIKNGHLKKL